MANPVSTDVAVIGSGVVGALVARKLALAGRDVLMLEAGPRIARGEIVVNFRRSPRKGDFVAPYPYAELAPFPIYQPEDNGYLDQLGPYPYKPEYLRVVGGTSWHWAAQAWRLLPSDFRLRTQYGVGRDWPISYDDLEPYYYEAEVLWGVSGPQAMEKYSPRAQPFPMPGVAPSYLEQRIAERLAPQFEVLTNTTGRNSLPYGGRPQCCGNNNCMPICPIDAQYHGGIAVADAEKAGVKLLAKAVVYKLEHDARGRITALHYFDWDKVSHRLEAQVFILAANAIEIPRILFLSADDKFPNGLCNNNDQLGRHLMDHPSNSATFYVDEPLWAGRGPMSPASIQTLRDGPWRDRHAAFRIDFSNSSRVASITAAAIAEGLTGKALDAAIRDRAAREISIKNVLEQLPDPNNRVTLSTRKKDALGLPTPAFSYSFDDYVERGMQASLTQYEQIARLLGATDIRYSKPGVYGNNQHITGTLAMGADPQTSVTDPFGRAWDFENLYMVSTGVMPTVATANSTLTASALGLRTADAILGRLKGVGA
ncbi:MAG: choline dehydrogenase [Candidatus Dactylopiibacterium carminicum]|uniref:Choline dehydrogenase n=1 Tax=Candidatus Dactylopiibacterium carminicum TaxID=857335 RepID=A0A272EYE6_9RHOO|nr:GMC family oxidoreductase [Candidatus Dactylopiibacterium carminicum]KAF7600641.1 GMC family oxidoreductase [Candidatus Dactylopiibacterium carminicum]PAS95125.1 MAG: choline dehydrogenase [Candidatus Dactylopiibacterium carminicum]PAS97929.1 MAG: choline dehydrogenase [Candidatus Dactylopiibacterium carminicum]PAT00638.1 MAG: choline dehydrogenase [Candidatus Dactylopiibacterium carminicum]